MRRAFSSPPVLQALEPRQLFSTGIPTFRPAVGSSPALAQIHVQPHSHVRPSAGKLTSPTPVGLTPDQVRHAYGFDTLTMPSGLAADGAGQTIAIVNAYHHATIASDLNYFSKTFGLPLMNRAGGPKFTVIKPRGPLRTDPGWAMESALDVEWAHAIAPKANIILVEAKSSLLTDMMAAVAVARAIPSVSVISMSWGAQEFSGQGRFDSFLTTPAGHTPISFVAASGDTGAPLNWPAASPNVVSVGGTTLSLDPTTGDYLNESAWSGSTGGISSFSPKPSYQSPVAQSMTKRTGPDVSYVANPKTGVAVFSTSPINGKTGWFQVGGTSAGSPQIAALVSLANQARATQSNPTLDGRGELLPTIYTAPPSTFRDITTGASMGKKKYPAGPGYDLATGRGTPDPDSLIQQLLPA